MQRRRASGKRGGPDRPPVLLDTWRRVVDQLGGGASVVIGGNPRKDQPIIGHRLRKAALAGARISFINPVDYEFLFDVHATCVEAPSNMVAALAAVAACFPDAGSGATEDVKTAISSASPNETQRSIAQALKDGDSVSVLLGNGVGGFARRDTRASSPLAVAVAEKGNVLFRGWGATYVLRPVPHVLSVRVCASERDREAEIMARLAGGGAPDLLATLCLATEAPIVIAPAMNRVMWANPAVQANRRTLEERGVRILGPGVGSQACGETGAGRMLEPDRSWAEGFLDVRGRYSTFLERKDALRAGQAAYQGALRNRVRGERDL